MAWQIKRKHFSDHYIVIILALAVTTIVGSYMAVSYQQAAAERAKDTVKTVFSFNSVPGWTRGPVNDTSLALFHTGTDGCFVYAEYKSGSVNAASELKNWSDSLNKGGQTITEKSSQAMTISTNYGTESYDLHQYYVPGTKENPTMEGVEVGYLQLPTGYIKFNGDCNSYDQLPLTIDGLQSLKFNVDKSYEFYMTAAK